MNLSDIERLGVASIGVEAPITSTGGVLPVISIPVATSSVDGYMTSTAMLKLDGIETGAEVNLPVGTTSGTVCAGDDGRLSDSRTPVSHSYTSHSDINQALLTTSSVTFSSITCDNIAMTGGNRSISITDGYGIIRSTSSHIYIDAAADSNIYLRPDGNNGALTVAATGAVTVVRTSSTSSFSVRNVLASTGIPTGGIDGNIWMKY